MIRIQTSPHFAQEKAYALQVLLGELLQLPFNLDFDERESGYRMTLPNGGELILEDHFFYRLHSPADYKTDIIPAAAKSFKNEFDRIAPVSIFGNPEISENNGLVICSLDLVADTFFMTTRWEEAASGKRDGHDRFPGKESLAFRSGFLYRPVVHEWGEFLLDLFRKLGWDAPVVQRKARLAISCDVDHPRLWWSGADRLKTLAGALFHRKNWKEFIYIIENQFFTKKDPFDIFDKWFEIFQRAGLEVQFNFLGKRPPSSDCWYPLEHPFVIQLLKKIRAHGHRIGFHPSYESFGSQEILERELASLESACGTKISSGRQHYLRFGSPLTWRQWAAAGLETDSTAGYPELPGFRCGICIDFPVFDIEKREILPLRELPLLAMDVTFALYQQYTPDQATLQLNLLEKEVKRHGGIFTLLWHNSSWDTWFWRDWQPVFLNFINNWDSDAHV